MWETDREYNRKNYLVQQINTNLSETPAMALVKAIFATKDFEELDEATENLKRMLEKCFEDVPVKNHKKHLEGVHYLPNGQCTNQAGNLCIELSPWTTDVARDEKKEGEKYLTKLISGATKYLTRDHGPWMTGQLYHYFNLKIPYTRKVITQKMHQQLKTISQIDDTVTLYKQQDTFDFFQQINDIVNTLIAPPLLKPVKAVQIALDAASEDGSKTPKSYKHYNTVRNAVLYLNKDPDFSQKHTKAVHNVIKAVYPEYLKDIKRAEVGVGVGGHSIKSIMYRDEWRDLSMPKKAQMILDILRALDKVTKDTEYRNIYESLGVLPQ